MIFAYFNHQSDIVRKRITDHVLIKADGDILFQGQPSLIAHDLHVTCMVEKSNRKISAGLSEKQVIAGSSFFASCSVLNPSNSPIRSNLFFAKPFVPSPPL
jgi:hypothetical protein